MTTGFEGAERGGDKTPGSGAVCCVSVESFFVAAFFPARSVVVTEGKSFSVYLVFGEGGGEV